jgi:hypothetical protein
LPPPPPIRKTTVTLRSLDSVRPAKSVHAIYFCDGPSPLNACVRLIEIYEAGIVNLAKLSSDDKKGAELKKAYAAEDQMIIIFGADETEIARFSGLNSGETFSKWITAEGGKLSARK